MVNATSPVFGVAGASVFTVITALYVTCFAILLPVITLALWKEKHSLRWIETFVLVVCYLKLLIILPLNTTFIWHPKMFQDFEICLLSCVLKLGFLSACHISEALSTFLNAFYLLHPMRVEAILTRNVVIFLMTMVWLLPIVPQIVVFGLMYDTNKDNLSNCNVHILPPGVIYAFMVIPPIIVISLSAMVMITYSFTLKKQRKQIAALTVEESGSKTIHKKRNWFLQFPFLTLQILTIICDCVLPFVVGIIAAHYPEKISDVFTAMWTAFAFGMHPLLFAYFALGKESSRRNVTSCIMQMINLITCRKRDER